ncbi:MAG: acyltransferase [Tatlockia sp.]|nr:acyltransferase [Tatlockia sp.]
MHGLDVLRSAAIIFVFLYHYVVFVSRQPTFGFIDEIGWVGVDLFFVLSGYLIGHQIFSPIANQREFSFKIFYYRRLLRTLPTYLFVLSVYFLIPSFRENAILPPLWKFLTFTQNFGLQIGTAFSHAWSLCVEEQFYLILPVIALLMGKKSIHYTWVVLFGLLLTGIILRSALWVYYTQHTNNHFRTLYYTKIYYCSFCRLDELVFGVAIAILRNFHKDIWVKITKKGNLILLFGIISSGVTFYLFIHYHYSLLMTAIGYPLLGISFAALTIAALSSNSYLYKIRIPGASTLAVWSYAIYLIHKPVSVIIYRELSKFGVDASSLVAILTISLASIFGGWLLYICVETPFLKLREKIGKVNLNSQIINVNPVVSTIN